MLLAMKTLKCHWCVWIRLSSQLDSRLLLVKLSTVQSLRTKLEIRLYFRFYSDHVRKKKDDLSGPDLRLLRTKQLNWPIRSIRVFKAILVKVIQLTLTLKMTTAQVDESSVTVNNTPIQDYVHSDDHAPHTYYTNLQLLCWCDWLTSDHSLYVLFAHMATFWTEQPTEGDNIIKHYQQSNHKS